MAKSIELGLKSEALGVLVDRLHKGEVNGAPDWTVYREVLLHAVLLACDKYDRVAAAERLLVRFEKCVKQAPWEIFCFASKTDQLSLARAALKVMGGDKLVGCAAQRGPQIARPVPLLVSNHLDSHLVTYPYISPGRRGECSASPA